MKNILKVSILFLILITMIVSISFATGLEDIEMTEDQKTEVRLRRKWYTSKENQILEEYKGIELEEVPEEYREKVRVLRCYGLGLTKEEELKRKMQKAVGKQVAHNEETRMELEEPYKSLETEEEDVEK